MIFQLSTSSTTSPMKIQRVFTSTSNATTSSSMSLTWVTLLTSISYPTVPLGMSLIVWRSWSSMFRTRKGRIGSDYKSRPTTRTSSGFLPYIMELRRAVISSYNFWWRSVMQTSIRRIGWDQLCFISLLRRINLWACITFTKEEWTSIS